jgi:hypothetical protein
MRLTRVEQWTRGKTAFPAYMSAFLVIVADAMIGALKAQAYNTEYAMLFSVKNMETWSRLYRDFINDATIAEVLQSLCEEPTIQAFPSFMEELETIKTLDDLNRPGITRWLREYLLDGFNLKTDESGYEERLRKLKPLFELPFISFAFRVYMPCVIYYQSTPQMLLERASNGDVDALRCLLRLDKNILQVPEIYAVWEPIS